MAREVYQWNRTAALNNFPPVDGGMPEGQFRSSVNDSRRESMRAVREWYNDPEWLRLMRDPTTGAALVVTKQSANVVRIAGQNMTAYFPVGRRVKIIGGVPDPVYAHVLSVAFAAGNTDVTLETYTGHTEVPATPVDILLHHSSTLGKQAFLTNTVTGFYLPAAATRAALQAAIDAANAAGGGMVLAYHTNYPLDATLTMRSNVILYGTGWWGTARLSLDNGVNAIAINFADGTSRAGVVGVTLNANGTGNLTGLDGISIGDGCTEIEIDHVQISDPRRDGIRIFHTVTPNLNIVLSNIGVDLPGRHGINVEDLLNSNARIFIGPVLVRNPGAYDNIGSGVKWAGQCSISDVQCVELNRGFPNTQRGLWAEQKLAAGSRHGRYSTVTGFVVRGNGAQSVGLEVGGEHNSFGTGFLWMVGATSRGISVDATLGGEVADRNVFTGIEVREANIGVRLESDALRNSFTGCHLRGCATGFDVLGDENDVKSCTIEGGTTHVNVNAGAAENVFKGNVHRDGTTGYAVQVGATANAIENNDFDNVTTPISDSAAAATRIYGNHPFLERSWTEKTAGDEAFATGAIVAIAGLSNLPLPGVGGNSTRKFMVSPSIEFLADNSAGTCTATFRIHVGATGTVADAEVYRSAALGANSISAVDSAFSWGPTVEITPASGARVTISCQGTATGVGVLVYGNTTVPRKSTVEIIQVPE